MRSVCWRNKTFLICCEADEGPPLIQPRLFQNASKDAGHADISSPEKQLSSVARQWALKSKTWVENYNFLLDFGQFTSLPLFL